MTERNTSSHRFPCIADRLLEPGMDTICVLYLRDSVAGFSTLGEGPATLNPVICQFVPAHLYGVTERPRPSVPSYQLTATVVRGVLMIGDRGPWTRDRTDLLDAAGRKVLDLHPGANDVRALAPGVYFVREAQAQAQAQAIHKVVKLK